MSSDQTENTQNVRMCASRSVKAIKSMQFDLKTKHWPSLAVLIIISSCCCFYTVSAAASGAPSEVKYPCAFIDTINVTGTPWAYEQPINVVDVNQSKTNYTNNSSNNTNSNNITYNNALDNVNIINISDSSAHLQYDNHKAIALVQSLGITTIPRELIAAYNFIIKDGVRITAERHLRACICKLKPCIRFCCDEGQYYDTLKKKCLAITNVIDIGNFNVSDSSVAFELTGMDHHEVPVRHLDGSTSLVKTAEHFNVNIGVPCERMRLVYKENQLVHWSLFENGTIAHRNYIFPIYNCLTPHQIDNSTWEWQPLACVPKKLPFVLGTKEWTYAICLILAVICMSIVLFVYLFCNEMRRSFFGLAIKVYALCIIIGYSLMAHLTLTDPAKIPNLSCIHIAACVILYLVLSFYVLSLISFNFYMQFHGMILSRLMFWLSFFPIVLVIVGWSMFVVKTSFDGKPIFGGDTCWFDPRNWSIMLYFYAPIFVACVLTIFFYILTLVHISEHRHFNVRKPIESLEENCFRSFWKFFSYTFLMFLACVISFAINYYGEEWSHINYAVCLFIGFHGFGALYALIGKNQKIQHFLRRIEDDVSSDDETESAVPMSGF